MKKLSIFIVLLSLVNLGAAYADELILKNGDRLTGHVIRMEDNKLFFKPPYADEIKIKWSEVSNLKTEKEVHVVLTDETSLKGFAKSAEKGKMKLKMGKIVETVSFYIDDIKSINSEPQIHKPVKTKGHINVGITAAKGNSDTEAQHLDGEFVARTQKNRYTLRGELNRAEDKGEKTVNNAYGFLKYDHFIKRKWFIYSNASFEKDEFKDLNLRSSLGAGAGYQFIESPITNLSFEAGLSYVNEDFDEAADDSYPGGRWAVNFDKYFWEKAFQFFHFHEGLFGLEDTGDIFIRSRTGVRVPLYKNIEATAQYHYDWDKSPKPGREKVDETYLLTLGYQW